VKIKSVEFREPCALANASLRTTVLLADSHEFELGPDGWLKWRIKGGDWHLSPPSMIRSVCLFSEEPTVSISNETLSENLELQKMPTVTRRGRPAKQ
jgi:hypothetical protein